MLEKNNIGTTKAMLMALLHYHLILLAFFVQVSSFESYTHIGMVSEATEKFSALPVKHLVCLLQSASQLKVYLI